MFSLPETTQGAKYPFRIYHNQLNRTGGNPFSGIKNAKKVNATKHNVANSKPILPTMGVLYFAENNPILRANEITQSTTSKTKLIMTALLLPIKPKVKNASINSP